MGLFDRSGSKLSTRPSLLLTADPGDALLDAARRYDPEVHPWHGRLVFANGVLLFGPIEVTKQDDAEKLLHGLAVRLGGTTHLVDSQSKLALLASVYSEQAPPPDQV